MKFEAARAVLWVEENRLTQVEVEDFRKLVNQGIIDIEKFLGIYKRDGIEYFVSNKITSSGVPTTGQPSVFLPIISVKNKAAPYLHETTHIVIPSCTLPRWLAEGLACDEAAKAMAVAEAF